MTRLRREPVGLLWRGIQMAAIALLAGCSQASLGSWSDRDLFPGRERATSALQPGDELLVEAALGGERCALRKLAEASGYEDFAVLCEGWSQPSGMLRRAPGRVNETLLARVLSEPGLLPLAPGAAACGDVQSLGGAPAARARSCTASDGWPLLAWAAEGTIDGRPALYLGIGPPHLAPIFEAAAAGGGERYEAGSRSPLVRFAQLQAEAGGHPVTLADIMDYRALVDLATGYNQSGEFANASAAYERALALQRRGQGDESAFTATVLAALALNYASDGRLADAERAFAAAKPHLDRLAWSDQYPRILSYRAAYRAMRGELAAAAAEAEEAVARWTALVGGSAPPVAHAQLVAAGIALARGDVTTARARAERARAIFESSRDRVGTAFALMRLALVEERAGEAGRALATATAARELVAALFADGRNLVDVELLRGRLAVRAGAPEVAREAFAHAARLVEAGRYGDRALAPEDLDMWLALLSDAASGGRPDDALLAQIVQALQLVGAPVFDAALRRMAVRVAAAESALGEVVEAFERLSERETELQLALGRLQLEDAYAPPGAREAELAASLTEVRQARAARERELQLRFPRYRLLASVRPVSLADLRRLLRPQEALLRIVTTESGSWTLLLTADGRARFQRSPLGRQQLADEIRGLREALTFEQGLKPFDTERAWALSRAILGDLTAQLAGTEHLIVVADGPLASLPLEVLPLAPPGRDAYHEVAWLGSRYAVSVLPSVAALELLRSRTVPSRAPVAFLGVGDPVIGGEGESPGAVARALGACLERGVFDPAVLRAMPALPETAEELERVAAAIGGRSALLLRAQANENRLRREALDRYRVLSFATHALLPGQLPCRNEPGLVLTPPDREGGPDDGFLSAGEIATFRLDADWVVLSACNTAGPDGSLGGETLSGLATGFAHAGARALLVSHWDVLSDPTVELVSETFRRWAARPAAGKARALLAARRQLVAIPDFAHPAVWAAFVLIGDGGATEPVS